MDTKKIIIGLVVFCALVTFPIWYSPFGAKELNVELVTPEGTCIRDTEYMRHNHMNLLNQWRDEVVRDNTSRYFEHEGKRYQKSLTLTCLGCHKSKKEFCDKCHNFVGVSPYCWDCHVDPLGE